MKLSKFKNGLLLAVIFVFQAFIFSLFNLSKAYSQDSSTNLAWPAPNEWTDTTEDNYALWVKKNAKIDFFYNLSENLHGLVKVDCFRAAIALRAYYAYTHGLRFYSIDTNLKAWDSSNYSPRNDRAENPESRAINFIKNMVASTSTQSVALNTFPVSFEKKSYVEKLNNTLASGDIFVFSHGSARTESGEANSASRHTYIVKDIEPSGYIVFTWATVPQENRPLTVSKDLPIYMPAKVSISNDWGFRRFYQPRDYENFKMLQLMKKLDGINISNFLKSKRTKGTQSADYNYINSLADIGDIKVSQFEKSLFNRGFSNVSSNILTEQTKSQYNQYKDSGTPVIPYKINSEKSFYADDAGAITSGVSIIRLYQGNLTKLLNTGIYENYAISSERQFFNLCHQFKARTSSVQEGFEFFTKNYKRVDNDKYYFNRKLDNGDLNNYSTTARDHVLRLMISSMRRDYLNNITDYKSIPSLRRWFLINDLVFNDGRELQKENVDIQSRIDWQNTIDSAPRQEFITKRKTENFPGPNLLLSPIADIPFDSADTARTGYEYYFKDLSQFMYMMQKYFTEAGDKVAVAKKLVYTTPLYPEDKNGQNDFNFCRLNIQTKDGYLELNLWDLVTKFENENLFMDIPWVSIERRWGLNAVSDEEVANERDYQHNTGEVIDKTEQQTIKKF